jgi:membrane-bound metal-dependent hydrolase YbcI (DUF457 family)
MRRQADDERNLPMTLYTHAFVGLGLGNLFFGRRMPVLFWFLAGLLPTLPDFDAFSYRTYGNIWGHRGWTHSLTFAIVVGLITAVATFRYFKMRFWLLAAFFFFDHRFARVPGRSHLWWIRHPLFLALV